MADSTSFVKPEPDEEKPTLPLEDEDPDEDAGDLEFYDKSNNQFETLYLARVPRYMWDAWLKMTERLGDDDEIQIGTLRTWNQSEVDAEGVAHDVTKLRMLLEANCPEHQTLPREYELEVLDRDVQNHFIFSEEDLPSYKARNKARTEAVNAGIPASLLRQRSQGNGQDQQGPQRNSYDRRSRFQPYFRKAIPKKTKMFGKIHYDVRVEPRNVRDEERVLARKLLDAEQSKSKLQIISRNSASSIMNPGTAVAAQWGGNFIKNAAQQVKPKKGEVFKAARIPKNQLLDLIFDCFRHYQYWSMKALRQKLQQPDTYLRQVLEEVAVLHKSGRFANHYGLSDAYKDKAGSDAKEEAATAAEDGGVFGDEDDDDDEELEDVLPA
ncbi:transcription initiation factor iif [Ophiocordyceps camponoti-floridani]|uniref:Transcription initiation factor IIF subunit beta n=1 Tax=Ophiocordyceps camponoti-floridani TaxID=2030778 RepID=A0A8H4VAR4_9HYPO|nr:transcription initiation factor iif [Ophiocordyceps camponoti-floridani]